jgi:hypothetical protein
VYPVSCSLAFAGVNASRRSNCDAAVGSSCEIVNCVNVRASGINLLDPKRREVTCRVTHTQHVTVLMTCMYVSVPHSRTGVGILGSWMTVLKLQGK